MKKISKHLKWLKLVGVLSMLLHLSRRLREKSDELFSVKTFLWIYLFKR